MVYLLSLPVLSLLFAHNFTSTPLHECTDATYTPDFLLPSNTQKDTLFNWPPYKSPSGESVSHSSVCYLDLSFFLPLCRLWLLSVKGPFHSIIHLRPIFSLAFSLFDPPEVIFTLHHEMHLGLMLHFDLNSSKTPVFSWLSTKQKTLWG